MIVSVDICLVNVWLQVFEYYRYNLILDTLESSVIHVGYIQTIVLQEVLRLVTLLKCLYVHCSHLCWPAHKVL